MFNDPNIVQINRYNQNINNVFAEKLNYELEKRILNENYINDNEKFTINIKRLISTDELILEFIFKNNNINISDVSIYSSIDNKEIKFEKMFSANNFNAEEGYKFQCILSKDSNGKNITFNKLRNLLFEINILNNRNRWEKLYALNYKFNLVPLQNSIKVGNNAIIKLISDIKISHFNKVANFEKYDQYMDVQYLNFNFIPTQLKQGFHSNLLYKITASKNWEKSTKPSSDIHQLDIYNLNIKNETENEYIQNKFMVQLDKSNKNNLLAYIPSYSYYDKNLKKTIIGNESLDAKEGLLIPLNFYGNFSHKISIYFNKNISDIKLTYNQEIKKPFFSYLNGLIKLSVLEKNYFESIPKNWGSIWFKNVKNINNLNIKFW